MNREPSIAPMVRSQLIVVGIISLILYALPDLLAWIASWW